MPRLLSRLLPIILSPLSLLYRSVTHFRNHLYNIGYKKTIHFTPSIISVGNLSVGGTGKTPMIAYLAHWLQAEHPLAILSRGYRRKTRGVRLASENDTAQTLGDEPYQLYRTFQDCPNVKVAVGEERIVAVPIILQEHPATELILLDDAYQHRAIGRNFNILLTSFQRPFYQDHLLPSGRLRESRQGARRADAVIVTKCPADLSEGMQQTMRAAIAQYTVSKTPVFFTGIRYESPQLVFNNSERQITPAQKVILFSGLADPTSLQAYVRQHFTVVDQFHFPDHHHYTPQDYQRLRETYQRAGHGTCLLTTEKDMVKLLGPELEWPGLPVFYLPIQVYFLQHEAEFQLVLKKISRTTYPENDLS